MQGRSVTNVVLTSIITGVCKFTRIRDIMKFSLKKASLEKVSNAKMTDK